MNGPGRATLLAFGVMVLLGGFNGTAIGLSGLEVPPLFGGVLRFGFASLIFFALVAIWRAPLPRGRALVGTLVYGLLGFAVVFGLVYWAIIQTGAGTAQVVLALAPLLTLLLAVAAGLERYRPQSLAGAIIAVVGIGLVFVERVTGDITLFALLALVGATIAIAAANVALKRFPHSHPLSNNAVAMGVAAVALLAASLVAGERWAAPQRIETILAIAYLVIVGSVVVFTLFLYVIDRWTASATSYSFLLMPLPALAFAALVLNEPITPALIAGGALVLVGVYLGAFAPSLARPLPGLLRRPPPATAAADGPPTLIQPNCP